MKIPPCSKPVVHIGFIAMVVMAPLVLLRVENATVNDPLPVANARVQEAYGKLPLSFEANRGQADRRVKFLSRGSGSTLLLTPTEAVLALRGRSDVNRYSLNVNRREQAKGEEGQGEGSQRTSVLRMELVGANRSPEVVGREELPGKANYFIGNDPAKWRTNIPTYQRVEYQHVYPGIDLLYYGNQRELEYDFVVRPGADPSRIALSFQGADRVEVDAQGDLVVQTALGQIRQRKPVIYQEVDGARRAIQGGYVLTDRQQVTFQVAAYDPNQPLVIDPVLFYSTYLGGSEPNPQIGEGGFGIAVDAAGAAYVTGLTGSPDFTAGCTAPCTVLDATRGGQVDAFVTKLNATGTALVYTTYLGGSGHPFIGDRGFAIAVDSAGAAYVTGITDSADFPTTCAAPCTVLDGSFGGGFIDAFVTKLNATGTALVYSTYLGGGRDELGFGIAVDAAGAAYVTGNTGSADFTAGCTAPCTVLGTPPGGFVTKLNAAGTALLYAAFLRGGGDGIAVDATGAVYVTGSTGSTEFTAGCSAPCTVLDSTLGGSQDAFVAKLDSTGTALVYSTYLGGSGGDSGRSIAVDAEGAAYVTGGTASSDFPTACTAPCTVLDSTLGGPGDAFVTKLDPTGTALVYSTYLGGSGQDGASGIAVDATGAASVAGGTNSTDFTASCTAPCTVLDPTLGGRADAFVTKLDPTGTALVYSTHLGGGGFEAGDGIALDATGAVYVTGETLSTDFPATPRAFQTSCDISSAFNACVDGFVTKIVDGELPALFAGKVTGGGSITVDGGVGTFEFSVEAETTTGPISGELQYVNHASGATVESVAFTGLVIVGKNATFDGTGTVNGTPGFVSVEVTDNGEPGKDDTFRISFSPAAVEGGTLRGGNIQLHEATLTLIPAAATTLVNTQHCVSATVEDAFGNPTPAITVRFSVIGPVTTSGTETTDPMGQATFCYLGPSRRDLKHSGTDTDEITAYADTDNNSVRDPGEPTGIGRNTWVKRKAPAPSTGRRASSASR